MKKCFAAGALLLASVGASFGSVILLSPLEQSGSGLGAVNTVLTLRGSGGTESGCVGLNSGGTVSTEGCGQPDSTVQNQASVPTLAALGVLDASDIRVVFNASEPGNARDIQLNLLTLTLYSSTGTNSISFNTVAPYYFPTTAAGVGNSGYVFGLDAPQAAAAQSFIVNNGNVGDVRVGLAASVGCGGSITCLGPNPNDGAATGGLETFYVQSNGNIPSGDNPVPESSSLLMMGGGFGALLAFARRRR